VLLAVLDTNVLVSAMLTPQGVCGEVLRQALAGTYGVAYDARILAEYEEVLRRPSFPFAWVDVEALLEVIRLVGQPLLVPRRQLRLPDESDRPFIEVAFAIRANFLVTCNKRHFPEQVGQGYTVIGPSAFLDVLG